MSDRKCYPTKERTPPLRIRVRTWEDSPNRFVMVEERRDDGWCRVGSVELSHGPIDARGACARDEIANWGHTRFHAAGDRVVVHRRLVADERPNEGYAVELEERREQVLGSGRDEHDWKTVDEWLFEVPVLGGASR